MCAGGPGLTLAQYWHLLLPGAVNKLYSMFMTLRDGGTLILLVQRSLGLVPELRIGLLSLALVLPTQLLSHFWDLSTHTQILIGWFNTFNLSTLKIGE